ncbi:uncharacterized protein ARB_05652 [Trichophyton benhamiae CBS 112371]|uniref:Uncharacterized protein n=1 Tax=Arthroderma benhamiae (strain ATCC MYA-4681 / CBS 112371) TaxID=663331 RepID=D4AN48_ARTBC|nr:uncharacterized protein ARB_05652 [Trichophyton benhamiae CBS 112371]EFE35609.1 hypothetical protein ARB_05652 [Trichophyton benhamiae CBS 112371]
MRVYSDYCRTRWRLPETSYSNNGEATLDYGGWEAEYAGRCLASSSNSHCLWLVAVDERYSELLSMNIEIPEQILSRTRRFRFDIKGCDGDTHHDHGQAAISSDEFRVSTSTRIAVRDAEDDQTLTVGSKTGIGIGIGLAVIALASLGFLRLYRRRRRRREIDSYLAASRPAQTEEAAAAAAAATTSTMAPPETIAEMPTDNETVTQSVFEIEGQGQKLGELQGSLAASEMPASSAHQQPAAPVELPGSIPRTT